MSACGQRIRAVGSREKRLLRTGNPERLTLEVATAQAPNRGPNQISPQLPRQMSVQQRVRSVAGHG